MIDVEMADDIRKYETKTFGSFTTRQLACMAIGIAYSVPIGLLLPIETINNKLFAIAILALPAILCGFVKMDGVYFEVIAIRMLYLYFLTPAKRKIVQVNPFHEAMNKQKTKEENVKLSKLPEAQRKEYYSRKKNKAKFIRYSMKKEYKIYQ